MPKEPPAAKQPGWLDAVASRCKYSRKDVQSFVKKYKIPLTPALGNPKRIHITSIVFSGKKDGQYTNDFEFKFENLTPGIWGLFSDGNGKGKSSVLEVIKWLIKGRISNGLQSGVKGWIRHAALGFCIDNIHYEVEIQQEGELFNGELKRAPDGANWQTFKTFSSEEEMAVVMSDFMLGQLELDTFASYKKGDSVLDSGSEVAHGWPALSAAMFIGTSYGAIFGDTAMAGLPNRILNMYLGLPWIPTLAALKTLEGQLKGKLAVESKYVDKAMEDRANRLADIQAQLEAKRSALSKLPQPQKSKLEHNNLIEEYNKAYELANKAKKRLADTTAELEIVEATLKADKISLQHFKEDKAARQVFKQLNPTCCPHCEQKITQERLEREKTKHTCAICDREMIDSQDSEEILNELTENLKASTKAHHEVKELEKTRSKAVQSAERLMADLQAKALAYKSELDIEQKHSAAFLSLKEDIGRLMILENEYSGDVLQSLDTAAGTSASPTEDETHEIDENKILTAALKETESLFKGLQEDLLLDVNKKMMDYCAKVGLGQYIGLKLSGQPALKIVKDGGETSFSKVSKGEQLRLKVLATVALISVAEERKLGRHPGFLIIDSPAAQEVNQDDLNNLILGLKELQSSLPSLQIILASVANETLLKHVDSKHRMYAQAQDFLW